MAKTEKNLQKYEKIKLTVGITESVISAILNFLFVWLGYSKMLPTMPLVLLPIHIWLY